MSKRVEPIDEENERIEKERKQAKINFAERLAPYNTPLTYVIIGFITTVCLGVIQPMFGIFMTNSLFAMNETGDYHQMKVDLRTWVLAMFATAIFGAFCQGIGKYYLAHVGENISMNMRSVIYTSIMKKEIGWHDDRENAPGVLSNTLAKDVNLLNGVSTEALAVICEAAFALLFGVGMGFYFDWRVALVALAITPF
mmetsp:Transcript_42048/g.30259  ORF Transcript_42048/g.30259 Transcript_42048/m.30259 type:complete len:197 (-) Transcript_42048:1653-2243(-)